MECRQGGVVILAPVGKGRMEECGRGGEQNSVAEMSGLSPGGDSAQGMLLGPSSGGLAPGLHF